MNVIYSQIEQEIVERLAPLTTAETIDVVALPEFQADFERPFLHGRVTVAYKSSEFGDIRSTDYIVQDEKIQTEVIVQARVLKGNTGLHSIVEAIKRQLLGFDPTDCTKLYLVSNSFKEFNNESALWTYSLVFQCHYRLVENAEYGTETGLEQINFEYNEELPSIPAIPFPGTFPTPPIINYKGDIAYWDGEVWRRLHPGIVGYVLATMGEGEVPEWVEPQAGSQGPQGEPGADGADGQDGADGASAYEVAVSNGFEGTQQEWLDSLRGADGQDGADGTNGADGADGQDGADGASAYEVAVSNGFEGTQQEWLDSLRGADGQDGADGTNGADGADGQDGADGASAYEVAVSNGFEGTQQEWLDSLRGADGQDGADGTNGADGADGQDGADGASAYEVAVSNGFEGTQQEWLDSLRGADGQDGADGTNGADGADGQDGADGASAYEVAVSNGFEGTQQEWLDSLRGADGQDGADGTNGADGADGQDGADGASAYEVAVSNGFEGTQQEWLDSLRGADGQDGADGTNGADGADGQDGADGASAYEVAVSNGFEGTEAEWLLSLKGEQGLQGVKGDKGDIGTSIIGGSQFTNSAINGSERFIHPLIGAISTQENVRQIVIPCPTTLSKFYIQTGNSQSGTGSYVLIVRKNGADTSVQITIPAGSAAGVFSATANTVTFSAGDLLGIRLINNASTSSCQIQSISLSN